MQTSAPLLLPSSGGKLFTTTHKEATLKTQFCQFCQFCQLLSATLIVSALTTFATFTTFSANGATPAITANPTPGYLIVLGRSTDRAKLIAYSATLPPIYSATGGRYIGLGRPGGGVSCVYGLCEGRSAVIARWSDQKEIEAFWWGDAYRQAVRLRDRAGIFTVVGLKGIADVAPFDPPGALLIATMAGAAAPPSATDWLAAAKEAGGRLLAPFDPAAVIPLEGDALYNRLALLSFASPAKRNEFIASDATQAFIKSSTAQSLIAIIAVDSPAPPPTAPPPSK